MFRQTNVLLEQCFVDESVVDESTPTLQQLPMKEFSNFTTLYLQVNGYSHFVQF